MRPGFLLNLNSGAYDETHVALVERDAEAHWFAIDRSILAQHGIALAGPPAAEVFRTISPEALVPLLAQSLQWHRRRLGRADDALLNGLRTLRFVTDHRWSSKRDAGLWASTTGHADPDLVRRALESRRGGHDVAWDDVAPVLEAVEHTVAAVA